VHAQPAAARPLCPSHGRRLNPSSSSSSSSSRPIPGVAVDLLFTVDPGRASNKSHGFLALHAALGLPCRHGGEPPSNILLHERESTGLRCSYGRHFVWRKSGAPATLRDANKGGIITRLDRIEKLLNDINNQQMGLPDKGSSQNAVIFAPTRNRSELDPPEAFGALPTRIIMPSVPFSGNTWTRLHWDIATGIGTQTMYDTELPAQKWRKEAHVASCSYRSYCGSGGGDDHRHKCSQLRRGSEESSIPRAVHEMCSSLCERNPAVDRKREHEFLPREELRYMIESGGHIHNARRNEPTLVKSHWPFLPWDPGALIGNVAILHLVRHPLTQYFTFIKHEMEVACPAKGGTFRRTMRMWISFHTMWKRYAKVHGLPHVVVRYENMLVNTSAAFETYWGSLTRGLPSLFEAVHPDVTLANEVWPSQPPPDCVSKGEKYQKWNITVSVEDLKWFAQVASSLLVELGYAPTLDAVIKMGGIVPANTCEVARRTITFEAEHMSAVKLGGSAGGMEQPSACKRECCSNAGGRIFESDDMLGHLGQAHLTQYCRKLYSDLKTHSDKHAALEVDIKCGPLLDFNSNVAALVPGSRADKW
jgi:hypothetical protein